MERLKKDELFEILNKLDDKDLLNFCSINRKYQEICQNEDFWRNRFFSKYGNQYGFYKPKNRTWRNLYLTLVYYENKYRFSQQLPLDDYVRKGQLYDEIFKKDEDLIPIFMLFLNTNIRNIRSLLKEYRDFKENFDEEPTGYVIKSGSSSGFV